jgi:cytochrome c
MLAAALAALAAFGAPAAAEVATDPSGRQTVGIAAPIGDPVRGATVFRQCASCHAVGDGAQNRTGPQLNGLFGRRAGSVPGYDYSEGLTRMGNDGLVWTLDTLDAYIENPRALVSRTRMVYRGMRNAKDRADVLAYLRDFSAQPANIPEAQPTARATEYAVDPALFEIEGDPAYGEYLSGECTTCHQASGDSNGIPALLGLEEQHIIVAMHAYKDKVRPHPVMQMIAGRLGNEEIAALAAYFATLDP